MSDLTVKRALDAIAPIVDEYVAVTGVPENDEVVEKTITSLVDNITNEIREEYSPNSLVIGYLAFTQKVSSTIISEVMGQLQQG